MKSKTEIDEMRNDLDGCDHCLPGSMDLNYKGAPTRDQLYTYIDALSWVMDDESDLPGRLEAMRQILAGEAEPLDEEEQNDSTDPH